MKTQVQNIEEDWPTFSSLRSKYKYTLDVNTPGTKQNQNQTVTDEKVTLYDSFT